MVNDSADFTDPYSLGLSRTQLRRCQRNFAKHTYLQAKSQFLALVRPLPAGALKATELETFRQNLFSDTWQPATLVGNSCLWCGIWTPLASHPNCEEYHASETNQDAFIIPGSISVPADILCEDISGENPIASGSPSAATGTYFCFQDLGAAVSASWVACQAAQPVLARAVILNGGQAIFVPSAEVDTEAGRSLSSFPADPAPLTLASDLFTARFPERLNTLGVDMNPQQAPQHRICAEPLTVDVVKPLEFYQTTAWTASTVPLGAYPSVQYTSLLNKGASEEVIRDILFARNIVGNQRQALPSPPMNAARVTPHEASPSHTYELPPLFRQRPEQRAEVPVTPAPECKQQ